MEGLSQTHSQALNKTRSPTHRQGGLGDLNGALVLLPVAGALAVQRVVQQGQVRVARCASVAIRKVSMGRVCMTHLPGVAWVTVALHRVCA